jgi:hypothetical protein
LQVALQIGSSTSPRSYKADLSKLSHYMHGVYWQTPDQIADELLRHMLGKSRDYFLDPRFYNIQTFKQLFSSDENCHVLAGLMRAVDDGRTSIR